MAERHAAEVLFLDNLRHIERIIEALSRRHGLHGDDADDFSSWAKMKLVEDDYAVLRKFRGESSIQTYLTVVIAMLFREYRVAQWGRWRPSAAAQRLGSLAVRLETLVHRDGYRLEEAGELLRTKGETTLSDRELAELLAELPPRTPLRPVRVGDEPLVDTPADSRADERVVGEEADRERTAAERALADALARLPTEDRLILRMRFWEELSVADIARGLAVPQKPLYRRIERALVQLRGILETHGITRGWVRAMLDEQVPDAAGTMRDAVHPIEGWTERRRNPRG